MGGPWKEIERRKRGSMLLSLRRQLEDPSVPRLTRGATF